MARDSALLARAARSGETVFSIYSWARPTLSFGRNQPALGRYDLDEIRLRGIDVVRRPTGGRAILHDHEVTYSVTAPLAGAPPLREAYKRINEILIAGLSRLGVPVAAASPAKRAPLPSTSPCFEAPAEGELVASGGKLVGSAQWRTEHSLLQHGSILVDDDQSSLPSLAVGGPFGEVSPPATLSSILDYSPTASEVAEVMFEIVREMEDGDANELSEAEVREETLLHMPHFLDESWTWRR